VKIDEGDPVAVEIDFLAGEYGGTDNVHRHQLVQGDLKARKAWGCELPLKYHTPISVKGKMPSGATNKVQMNLSDVVPFIVMNGMALYGRLSGKDAWDIYFCIRNYKGGIEGLAAEFQHVLENKLVQEGLGKVRAKFMSVDAVGPIRLPS